MNAHLNCYAFMGLALFQIYNILATLSHNYSAFIFISTYGYRQVALSTLVRAAAYLFICHLLLLAVT